MTTPVNMVNGIGPKTTEFLRKKRITTVEALLKRGVTILENAPGFSPGRAEKILQEANKLLGKSTKTKSKKDKSDKKSKKDKKNNKSNKKSKNKSSKDKKGKKNKNIKDKKRMKDKKSKKNKK